MDWLEIPVKCKRALIMFMERIKRNINLVAGDLVPLSNSTFVSVSPDHFKLFLRHLCTYKS